MIIFDCGKLYSASRYYSAIISRCRSCGTSVRMSGEKNPLWRGGHKYWQLGKFGRDKDGLSWKVQRRLCWERDNYSCQDCGKTKSELGRNPDVDHEIPYRISFSHDISNLKCRCSSCHKKIEAKRPELWGGKTWGGWSGPKKTKILCVICCLEKRFLIDNKCSKCIRKEKTQNAINLRKQGIGYVEISEQLGINHQTAWNYINLPH